MTKVDMSELQCAAFAAADAARGESLAHFRQNTQVDNKAADGFDPVTAADRAAERAIRETLQRYRPADAVVGEELKDTEGTSGLTWVIDPIDGTRAYISGAPTWGTLIAVSDESGPIAGLIDQPFIGERFWGAAGEGVVHGPHGTMPLRTSRRGLEDARLFTTFPEVGRPHDRAGFDAVMPHVRLTRYGLDCYAYALVALGEADLVIEAQLNAYDIQAPIAVVQAAGGVATNWSGGPAHHGGQVVVSANPALHSDVLELLEPFADG